jgi:AcrR family transcriptional regulator
MATQRSESRPGLREAQRRFTRQHILDAAIDVFVERGYIAATVEDIIERAGTSRRTFYTHFRSKADVLVEFGRELLPEIKANYSRLDEALQEESPEPLREWFLAIIDWGARYGGLVPVWQEAAAVEPAHEELRQEIVESFPQLMPRYFARWPKKAHEEAHLRVVLLSVQLDRFFAYAPPREMDAAERELVANVLTQIWSPALQEPPT